MTQQSARAQIIERRTYLRPLDKDGKTFETREQAWERVINHQRWLWERAQRAPLDMVQEAELDELRTLFLGGMATVSGRTRWLGGTDVAKSREASQFNCAFGRIQTVHDVVDSVWLLLQGCGVGFSANVGVLNGFAHAIPELEIIRSKKVLPKDAAGNPISDKSLKGNPNNVETFDNKTGVWKIIVGDSAEAWAKFFGKIMAGKKRATKLIISFEEIRPAGYRLSGYGWISSGDEQIAGAVKGIFEVMCRAAGRILSAIDILDIENYLGTILASRRSAEIALYRYKGAEWEEFAVAKKGCDDNGKWHRGMSNNSLLFYDKPQRQELEHIFDLMKQAGGSEPGFINAEAAIKRAPYFRGVNPCAEILLGDKSFCNLVEIPVSRFNGNSLKLQRAMWIAARANYRQTCVNLDDGILQRTWHELNEFLRLCGVGITGVIGWEHHKDATALQMIRESAVRGANGMADELGLPHPMLVTTIKPSGTQSKVFGQVGDEVAEGAHRPLARYLMNRINFSKDDPLVEACRLAGYTIEDNPSDSSGRLVVIPVEFNNIEFDKVTVPTPGGDVVVEVNLESATDQLDRYKFMQDNYVDHNCSITIYYSPSEVRDIITWLRTNWDSFIGVSFLYRPDPVRMVTDPAGVAKDLGYAYLPQTPSTEAAYTAYADRLLPVNFSGTDREDMVDTDECESGACPIR